jgi:acyl carrier protein
MAIEDFLDEVSDLLDEVPTEGLCPSTDFKGLKCWDSLAVLTVTDSIDMEYGVLLNKKDYHNCQTLQELFDLISSRKKD